MRKQISPGRPVNDLLLIEQLRQKEREQSLLLSTAMRLAAASKRDDLLQFVDEGLLDILNAKFYTIFLVNEDKQTYSPFLFSNNKLLNKAGVTPTAHEQHFITDEIFNTVVSSETPLIIDLKKSNNKFVIPQYLAHWQQVDIREILAVRMIQAQKPVGILYLFAEEKGSFQAAGFPVVEGFAAQVTTGISHILANEKMDRQLEEIKRYRMQLAGDNSQLLQAGHGHDFSNIIGSGAEMQKIFSLVSRVSHSDSTVLLLGETGTGKELIANAIHRASLRKDQLMVRVNCASLPVNLIESELFGHEKGSFTGAADRRIGKFELANNGTIFLDEIGELPLDLQVKLLRVLQEKEIERVGGQTTIKVDVRVIAATNRDLRKEVEAGQFRSDLYYRLNVFPILMPPLRKRKEDIPLLVSHFIERYSRKAGKKVMTISQKALEEITRYSWPGNIRELEHLIERTVLLTTGTSIREIQLTQKMENATPENGEFLIRPLHDMERSYILKVVQLCNGRISGPKGAAVQLALPATTLISKMKKLGIRKQLSSGDT